MFGKQTALKVHNTLKSSLDLNSNPKIEKAKQFPLESIYSGKLARTGKVLMGVCPFHQEDTASFAIYLETNTYHCFGCNVSGDAISLYQKIKKCGFMEAVGALQ
jgi:DNA primase